MKRVVFMHGVGSSGSDLRPLADALGLSVPAHFPDGTHPFDMGPGRQWFSVRGISEANRPERVTGALPALTKVLEGFGPTEETLLIGFSQGSIMALHAAAAGMPLAGVIAIAGRLAGPVPAQPLWPQITLLNGDQDHLMPPPVARATADWLRDAGATPTAHILPGLGHTIDHRVVDLIRSSLAAG